MTNLGQKLRIARESAGISQRRLAKLADVSNDYVSKIEMGKIENVGIVTLKKICDALNISPLDIQDFSKKAKYKIKESVLNVKEKTVLFGSSKPDALTSNFFKKWQKLNASERKVLMDMAEKLALRK